MLPAHAGQVLPHAPAGWRPEGRPTHFNEALAQRIAAELEKGQAVTQIALNDWAPCEDSIYSWCARHPQFADLVARARERGAAAIAESTLRLADMAVPDERGRVEKERLQILTRQKYAGYWNRRFADKQIVEHEGSPSATGTLTGQQVVELIQALRAVLPQQPLKAEIVEAEPAGQAVTQLGKAATTTE